jgi:hypothetical protein
VIRRGGLLRWLLHCNKNNQVVETFQFNDYKGFKFVFLFKADCSKCKKAIYNYAGVDIWGRRNPQHGGFDVKHNAVDGWLSLIKSGQGFKIEKIIKDARDTRGMPIVGDATREMCKDPALVYSAILRRFKSEIRN